MPLDVKLDELPAWSVTVTVWERSAPSAKMYSCGGDWGRGLHSRATAQPNILHRCWAAGDVVPIVAGNPRHRLIAGAADRACEHRPLRVLEYPASPALPGSTSCRPGSSTSMPVIDWPWPLPTPS